MTRTLGQLRRQGGGEQRHTEITGARGQPHRSPSRPTIGTITLPMPQAKPIISDETVAAPTGASICA